MQGIARDPKGNTTAMVVNADGVVEQRPVVVSQTIRDQWLVESGLAAGDRVVVEGLQKIAPAAKVDVADNAAAQPPLATPAPDPDTAAHTAAAADPATTPTTPTTPPPPPHAHTRLPRHLSPTTQP